MASVRNTGSVEGIDLLTQVKGAVTPHPRETPTTIITDDAKPAISQRGKFFSAIASLSDAVAKIERDDTWRAKAVATQGGDAVVATGDDARTGAYQVDVNAMAQAQVTASPVFSSLSTVIGLGTLHIEMGTWNASQTAFATNPNWPKASVNFGPKDHTLEQVRDRINASGAGVVATVVSDATGSRLVLRATSTGQANGFKVSAETTSSTGAPALQDQDATIRALAFDPRVPSEAATSTLLQAAQDAGITINQRTLTSGENVIDDPESKLRIQIQKQTSDNRVLVEVTPDTSVAARAVTELVSNYNQLLTQPSISEPTLARQRAVTLTVNKAFEMDSTDSVSSASELHQVGLSLNHQGEIVIDASRLTESLTARPADARRAISGLARQIQEALTPSKAFSLAEAVEAPPLSTPSDTPSGAAADRLTTATSAGSQRFRSLLAEQYAAAQGQRSVSENAA